MKVTLNLCAWHGRFFPNEPAPVWGVQVHTGIFTIPPTDSTNVDNVEISHGMCKACAEKQMQEIDGIQPPKPHHN